MTEKDSDCGSLFKKFPPDILDRFEGNWDTTSIGTDRMARDMTRLRELLAKRGKTWLNET